MRYMNEQIVVGVYQKDNLFLMSVKDDGKGFSEEDLRQATNMFYGNEKGNEHFGIGLGVCRLLCEKRGGFFQIGIMKFLGSIHRCFRYFGIMLAKIWLFRIRISLQ